MDGLEPNAEMQIGTVSQRVNEAEQKIDGELWLFPEKCPEKLKIRIDNGEKIPISAGILLDSLDEDGTQRGIQYTHVAVLEGEDPKCPLDKCGFNLRLESNDRLLRLEQQTDAEIKQPKAEPETEATPAKEEPTTVEEPEAEQPKTETPVEQKPAETDEQVQPEVQAPPEPEIIIPPDVPQVQKPFTVDAEGNYVWVLDAHKQPTGDK